jgi:hypothetical protein
MKKTLLLLTTVGWMGYLKSQVSFDGNLTSSFTYYNEKVIDVSPNKEFFDKTGKYDASQNLIWNYSGLSQFGIKKVKSDRNGGCLVAGDFMGNVIIGNDTLKPYKSNNAPADVVLVHFNSSGQKDWWIRFSDYWNTYPTTFYSDKTADLECDGNYAYLSFEAGHGATKYYIGPNYSDSIQIPNRIAIFKIDLTTGNIVWNKIPVGSAYGIYLLDMSVNNSGELAFNYSSTSDLDWGNGVSATADGTWVVKLSASGNTSWATRVSNVKGLGNDSEVEMADNGEVYTAAKTPNAYPNTILNIPTNCNYIAKMSTTGNIEWSRKFSNLTAYEIDIAYHFNHIYFRNSIGTTAKYVQSNASDSIAFVAGGTNNSSIYFGRFDASGNLDWHVIETGGSGSTNGFPGILQKIDDGSGIFCVGGFTSNSVFGSYTLPSGFGQLEKFLMLSDDNFTAHVSENTINGIELFPNPTESFIHIVLPDFNISEYEIYDLTGKLVHKGFLYNKENSIDLKDLKGLYLIKIQQNNSTYYTKFLKM